MTDHYELNTDINIFVGLFTSHLCLISSQRIITVMIDYKTLSIKKQHPLSKGRVGLE